MTKPARGEIWIVDFDPQEGAEISKRRPAAVVQDDSLGKLPLYIVVPITDWKERYASFVWHTKIPSTAFNGLAKDSSADSIQIKSVSLDRFIKKMGTISDKELENVVAAVALCVGY